MYLCGFFFVPKPYLCGRSASDFFLLTLLLLAKIHYVEYHPKRISTHLARSRWPTADADNASYPNNSNDLGAGWRGSGLSAATL